MPNITEKSNFKGMILFQKNAEETEVPEAKREIAL